MHKALGTDEIQGPERPHFQLSLDLEVAGAGGRLVYLGPRAKTFSLMRGGSRTVTYLLMPAVNPGPRPSLLGILGKGHNLSRLWFPICKCGKPGVPHMLHQCGGSVGSAQAYLLGEELPRPQCVLAACGFLQERPP